ncbi:MAG: 4Fe-4S binding protein [Anaerolineae bacterium]|nr:4Fe-4S binding protein [Anaerolineae bacterium]
MSTDYGPWLPRVDRVSCTGCRSCIVRCPTGALGQVNDKAALIHPELCTYCAACEDVCPVSAIELPYLIVKCPPREDSQYE